MPVLNENTDHTSQRSCKYNRGKKQKKNNIITSCIGLKSTKDKKGDKQFPKVTESSWARCTSRKI